MKKTLGLLLVIVILTCTIYFVSRKSNTYKLQQNKNKKINDYGVPLPQANTSPSPDAIPYVIAMPTQVPLDSKVIATYPDLD